MCLKAVLTTSAAVAARAPVIQLKDNGGATVYKAAFTGTQAASTAQNYSAAEAGQVFTAAPVSMTVLPQSIALLQNFTISSLTAAIDAADQWTAIQLCVREWLEQ